MKEALKLSWETQDIEAELRIYQSLSVNYYYNQAIEQAKLYHQKYMSGTNEKHYRKTKNAHVLVNQHERERRGIKMNFFLKPKKVIKIVGDT